MYARSCPSTTSILWPKEPASSYMPGGKRRMVHTSLGPGQKTQHSSTREEWQASMNIHKETMRRGILIRTGFSVHTGRTVRIPKCINTGI